MDYIALHKEDGKCYCAECRGKMRVGENNPYYKPELSVEYRTKRRLETDYAPMRLTVLARDNYQCVCCKGKEKLEVHHLYGYKDYEELRCEPTNCVTLCHRCHMMFHNIYGKSSTKEQFEEWIGYGYGEISECDIVNTRKIICLETGKIYNSSKQLSRELKISTTMITRHCSKRGVEDKGTILYSTHLKNNHYMWLDNYIKMTINDIEEHLRWCFEHFNRIQVQCVNTGEVFNSASEAARCKNISTGTILENVHGRQTYGGIDKNGMPLVWKRYVPDFALLAQTYYDNGNSASIGA